jgi:hypothetical protein
MCVYLGKASCGVYVVHKCGHLMFLLPSFGRSVFFFERIGLSGSSEPCGFFRQVLLRGSVVRHSSGWRRIL